MYVFLKEIYKTSTLTMCNVGTYDSGPNFASADKHMEEIQFDLSLLSTKEIDIALLFIYPILYNSAYDHVCSRGLTT